MPETYMHALVEFGIFVGMSEVEANKFSFDNLRNILASL